MNKDLRRLIGIIGIFTMSTGFMGFLFFTINKILLGVLGFGIAAMIGLITTLYIYSDHDEEYFI